jgi:hypothetical protein
MTPQRGTQAVPALVATRADTVVEAPPLTETNTTATVIAAPMTTRGARVCIVRQHP